MAAKNKKDASPDGYVFFGDSPAAAEHQLISELLTDPRGSTLAADSRNLSKEVQMRLLLAAVARMEFQKRQKKPQAPLSELIKKLAGRKLSFTEEEVRGLLASAATIAQPADPANVQFEELDLPIPGLIPALLDWVETRAKEKALSPETLQQVQRVHDALKPMEFWAGFKKTVQRLESLLEQRRAGMPDEGEAWAEAIRNDIARLPEKQRKTWLALLENAPKGTTAKPTAAWRKQADTLLAAIGAEKFAARVEQWFGLVGTAATERIRARNAALLRALVWYASLLKGEPVCRALANGVEGGLRKLPNGGLYASSIAKACIAALEVMPGSDGVAQLLRLKHRVKSPWGQEEIQKALASAVNRSGVSVTELEEITTPTFDLDSTGALQKKAGPFTAQLQITGTHEVTLSWLDSDGKALANAAKSLKPHGDEVKSAKRLASDIEKMLVAQRERIEQLYRADRTWPFQEWRKRYLDHPLLGHQCRRLIWQFTEGKRSGAAIWHDGDLVDANSRALAWLKPASSVQLWHPLGVPAESVHAWREWLETNEITQPFKQAHREIYVLTDAELTTRTYSNRFAAHVLRQHQFKALCDARGWKYEFLGSWDSGGHIGATLDLPHWELRAHFWLDHAGSQFSPAGVALHVSSDQVRFSDANTEARELASVPALAFSEVMRDVDLFVGVSSIGADPAWQDGGEERHRAYWHDFSFGELNATAETRRDVLTRLLPKLRIAGQCSLEGKFLVVRGKLRTYKIHLGSGNILMQPNDQYLCIVPDRSARTSRAGNDLFLPFEGDHTLAVILSKAFLLAEDDKISDATISNQIKAAASPRFR
jgi:hypothetical protein